MNSNYFIGYSGNFDNNFEVRDNYLDVWKDVLLYSSCLNGNWVISRRVFYESIVPTAEKSPAVFARWINKLVKTSGLKIKSRSGFLQALKNLRKFHKKNNRSDIKKVLFGLLESGLNEPSYAIKALKISI